MDKLGIEPIQLIIQIFNFAVMVAVLTKFLYKPILRALDTRRKKIEEGLSYADKMKEEAEKNEKRRTEIITHAKEEARKIVEEGKKGGKRLEEEIIEKAHKEEALILDKGRREIDIERIEMEKELRGKTVEIAMDIVQLALKDALDDKDHIGIINKKIKELEKHIK